MKCRLKKKHEHDEMKNQLDILKCQGVELTIKVGEVALFNIFPNTYSAGAKFSIKALCLK